MRRRFTRTALALAMGLVLGACGGGGDDTPDPTAYNVAAAYQNLLTTTNHWALTGTDSLGIAWTVQLDGVPQAAGAFPMTGEAAGRFALTLALSAEGTSQSDTETYYFDSASPAKALIGIEMSSGCLRASSFMALPEAATIGTSRSLATMTVYDYCSLAAPVVGTFESRWALVRDGNVVLFCHDRNYGGGTSDSACFETATNGTLGSHARLTVKMPNYTLIAKNY